MITNTFVITCLRSDYINRCIETLYTYTPINFKVVVVDQTLRGLPDIKGVHLRLRPHRNLGFAKAMNEGMIHGLHWGSEYVTCWNDDVECINKRWWQGIIDTFNMESSKEIVAVAPESPRIPLWGYGRDYGEYIDVIPYKEKFTEEDYDFLMKGDFTSVKKNNPNLPKTFPDNYNGVCDAIAAWGPVFKASALRRFGLWDERFYPGAAEDYDFDGRIYSQNCRAVSTRKSWVWHHWGKSRNESKEVKEQGMPIIDSLRWQDLTYLWPPEYNEGHPLDVWGFYTSKDGTRKPLKRRPEIGVVEI